MYKRNCEILKQQNNELQNERQRLVYQLQSIFSLYNKQKATIERLDNGKKCAEQDKISYKNKLDDLEREKERLKKEQNRETENMISRYKSINEEMEQRIQKLEKRLTTTEEENHKLVLVDMDLKEQLRNKEKRLMDAEYSLESTRSKLERELELLRRQKEQYVQDKRSLEEKLEIVNKDIQRQFDNERSSRKELARLTYFNEELTEEVQRLKRKCNIGIEGKHYTRPRIEESYETPNEQRLAGIERKLETILKYQKTSATIARSKQEQQSINGEEESQEDQEDDENLEGMLKDLTAQILEKDELKNANVITMFKLDQIDLDDKEREYKNLLKAMAALYFANRYNKMVPSLFNYWKEKLQERIENCKDEVEELEEEENENENEEDVKYLEETKNEMISKNPKAQKESLEIDTELANKEVMGRDITDKKGAKDLKQDNDWNQQFDENDDFQKDVWSNRKARSNQSLGERDFQDMDDEEQADYDFD